jgi:hypothetical protein
MIRSVLFFLVLCFLEPVVIHGQDQPRNIAFTNVNVIPLDKKHVLTKQTVLIKNGLIENISSNSKPPGGYEIIDGSGKYLIPGFADMHAHFPGFQSQPFPLDDYFFLNLANGVTTLRGMRGHPAQLAVRDSLIKNAVVAPQLLVSSPPITRQNNSTPVRDFRKMFALYKEQGYDFIKILSLDGKIYDSIMPLLKKEDWLVAGHSPDGSLSRPVESGQHSIEHIEPFVTSYTNSPDDTERLLLLMRAKGIYNCPDIYWYYIYGYQLSLDSLQNLPAVKYVTAAQKNEWISSWKKRFSDTLRANENRQKYERDIAIYTRLMHRMDELGIRLLVSPGDGTFIVPGFSYIDELEIFERAGIDPYAILRSASFNAAKSFGEQTPWGMVAQGYRADLILVSENPLAAIKNVKKIEGVMVSGRWLSKEYLAKGLKALELKYAGK